jgi:hypothetical protein
MSQDPTIEMLKLRVTMKRRLRDNLQQSLRNFQKEITQANAKFNSTQSFKKQIEGDIGEVTGEIEKVCATRSNGVDSFPTKSPSNCRSIPHYS